MRAFVILILIFQFSACHAYYGVSRHTQLQVLPEISCVDSAIKTLPDIKNYSSWVDTDGHYITWKGFVKDKPEYLFAYSGDGFRATVEITENLDGEIKFAQTFFDINKKPPQEYVDRSIQVMKKVEESLEKSCGIENLTSSIEVACSGVPCEE